MKILIIVFLINLVPFSNIYTQILWEKTNGFEGIAIYSLAINSNGAIFAGTDMNGLYRSTDNGNSWTNLGFTNTWIHGNGIAISPSQEILVATDNKDATGGVFRSSDNGNNWNSLGLTDNAETSIAVKSNGNIFVGTAAQGVYRSTDNGQNFVLINGGLDTSNGMNPISFTINSSGDIFVGTVSGGVFRSTNNGDNWVQINQGLTSYQILSLGTNSSGYIFAGTSGGGAFRSTNNGANWVEINQGLTSEGLYIFSLAINSNGDIFAGTADGIFRSIDNGNNWIQINQGLTNLGVLSLAINLNGDVFAGTLNGVFRTIPSANIKVFLQGPYASGSMSTNLNTSGYIPLSQPYNTTPWNYNGVEAVVSIPAGVVDWVLLELRSDLTTQVSRRAAFLKSDGSIVDLDGVSNVRFPTVTPGTYYVVIRHRNHLAVMTANKVTLSGLPTLYDMRTDQSKTYFGTDAMKSLGGGNYGMYAADGNKDGGIYGEDYILYQTSQGEEGYRIEDYNLDGGVYGEDYILYQLNQGYETWVP